jgi:AcrR family transcriptional regulator
MAADNQDGQSRNNPIGTQTPPKRTGRPRSQAAHRAILDAARAELVEVGFTRLRLEVVAARAGVGKATIYRRWPSKEALCQELLAELAGPHIAIAETGDTRGEMLAAVTNAMQAVRDTPFGPVYFRLMFGGELTPTFADRVVDTVYRGYARQDVPRG